MNKVFEGEIEYDVFYYNVYGEVIWTLNQKFHRELGPAIECLNGKNYWYWHGQPINCQTQEEFEHYLRLKAFW